jgi:adenylosuccinate lyase
MRVWEEDIPLVRALMEDEEVRAYLSEAEIEAMCRPEAYLRHVDEIYDRVLGS